MTPVCLFAGLEFPSKAFVLYLQNWQRSQVTRDKNLKNAQQRLIPTIENFFPYNEADGHDDLQPVDWDFQLQ